MHSITTDFSVVDDHSLFLLQPITSEPGVWISENIPSDAQYFGSALVVEHRYIQDMSSGKTASLSAREGCVG